MIWQNPWAWLGLATIAIPILIHLLGRDKAPRHSFPSLRFIEIAELPPTRRTRLHDLVLLAARVTIFALAAAALAQPLLLDARRRASIDRRIARAIIVDTSASMQRLTPSGGLAIDSARGEARRLASDAQTSVAILTSAPSAAISGAVEWLESQPSRRELVIVSDFQTGTIDSSAIAGVPLAIGVRAIPISTTDNLPIERRSLVRDASVVARVDVAANPTVVSWTIAHDSARLEPRITLDAKDRSAVEILTAAATTLGVAAPIDTSAVVTVVTPNAENRDELTRRSAPVFSPRLTDVVARLYADPLSPSALGFKAAEDTAGGVHRLLLFSNDSVASVNSAILVAATRRALSIAPAVEELDPSTIPTSLIASWQRAPSATPTRESVDPTNGPSDARWLWAVVLALLGVEAWLRREQRAAMVALKERAHDRAA